MYLLALQLGWGSGCGAEPPAQPAMDYVRAVSATDLSPDQRLALCESQPEPETAAECAAGVAATVDADLDLCDRVPAGIWRDECWFRQAERGMFRLDKPEIVQTCARAGRWESACIGHIWDKLGQRLAQDKASAAVIEAEARAWAAAMGDPSRARDFVVSAWFQRLKPQERVVFDDCGPAADRAPGCPAAVVALWAHGYQGWLAQRGPAGCAEGPTATAAAFAPWVRTSARGDEAAALAQKAWRAFKGVCKD